MLDRLRHPLGLGRVRDDLAAACEAGTDTVIVSHDPPRVCRGRFGECGMRTLTLELRLDRALPQFEPGALCTISYSFGNEACTFSARVADFFPAERVGDRPVLVLGHPREIATEGSRSSGIGRIPRELRIRPFGLGLSLVVPLTLDAETWLRVESGRGVVLELHRHTREERARRARGEATPGVFARLVRGSARDLAASALGRVAPFLTGTPRSPGRWWTRGGTQPTPRTRRAAPGPRSLSKPARMSPPGGGTRPGRTGTDDVSSANGSGVTRLLPAARPQRRGGRRPGVRFLP